ncbi:MAG: hypothetical protein K2H53_02825 [Clostridia bacterium]|nr:hypothetical protein [Clostridia bacterium]
MSGAKIIPIGIQAKKKYRPFSKIIINIGKPIDFSKYKNLTHLTGKACGCGTPEPCCFRNRDKKENKEILDTLSKTLMEEMIRLTNEDI